jgi:hypothetical protein
VHRAIGRRRRRQHVAQAVAAVALALAAVGTGALVLRAEDNKVRTGSEGTSTTVPTTTATTPTTTATTPTTTTGGAADRQNFGPVSFVLPDGWEIVDQRPERSPLDDRAGETMCIAPAGDPGPQWEGCGGLLIHQGGFLPGKEMNAYAKDTVGAWSHATDASQCPFEPGPPDGLENNYTETGGPVIDQGTRAVGEHTADYNRWQANCQLSDHPFEPQAWFLPQSKVLIFDVFGHDETEAFLASFQFDG